jgi:probable addiction module antidote protein
MGNRSKPFKIHDLSFLKDPEQAALYLEECYAEGDNELFQAALKDVAKAQEGGLKAVAEAAGLNRENLYRALSKNGNPQSKTIQKVLAAVGIEAKMTFVPKDHMHV